MLNEQMDKASDIKAALPFLINLNYTKKGLLSDELRVRGSRKGSEEAVQLENWNVLARRKGWRGTAARLPGPGPAAPLARSEGPRASCWASMRMFPYLQKGGGEETS